MDIQNIASVPAFTTKDGSEIRELLAHRNSCIVKQSLAEARLPPGASTTPHYHPLTEETYYILSSEATMRIDRETRQEGPGDAIAIPPGKVHQITNSGSPVSWRQLQNGCVHGTLARTVISVFKPPTCVGDIDRSELGVSLRSRFQAAFFQPESRNTATALFPANAARRYIAPSDDWRWPLQ